MKPVIMILLILAVFAAVVLNLAAQTRLRRIVMGTAAVIAVAIGAIWYGYGYAWCYGVNPTSMFRSLLAMCRMFGGVNDMGSIAASPLLGTPAGTAVFWFGHFCAFYVTASAAITTLGESLLRRIRVTLLRNGPLLVIYGVNSASVSYGKDMAGQKGYAILFVDPDGDTSFESTIRSFGAVLEKDKRALEPDQRFLRHINMGQGDRRLELAAMHADGRKNLHYAEMFCDAMAADGIEPRQTSLLISGIGDKSASFQASEGRGFGRVLAFDDYELTARLVIREFPPCDRIAFDETGKAAEDFHAVILGYGRMGRAMLAQLVCNGQFCGSRFRADVFDPVPQNGFLHGRELTQHYDIRFHSVNGMTDEFYSFLEENRSSIRCIILCTGNPADNREIAEDLAGWFRGSGRQPMIIQTSKGNYYGLDESGGSTECTNIYRRDVLDIDRIDAMAMQINQMYCRGNGLDAEENWEKCGYFDRMSSRASADFYPAILRCAGQTEEQVLNGGWPPKDEVLENLAITEHLRWCAFHYVMGYRLMPQEIYEQRAEQYLREKEKTGAGTTRIGKDSKKRLHACLIPWEELDALSERENAVTGGTVDYKSMDRDNILAIPQVIAAMKEAGGGTR